LGWVGQSWLPASPIGMLMTIPFSATVSTSGFWLGLVAMTVSVVVEGWSLLVPACSGNWAAPLASECVAAIRTECAGRVMSHPLAARSLVARTLTPM